MKDHSPKAGTREWFRVQAKADDAEVFIYDEIGIGFYGGGIAAVDLIKEIKELNLKSSSELLVHINSQGGSFFEGITIHNYLRTVKAKVVVRIDGVAASSASIIAMAGDRIEMPENAMLFIHNPWTVAIGDANAMRKSADDLDQMRDSAASTYMRRAGDKMDKKELVRMLDDETWLSAEQSVDFGLADVVDEPVRAAALLKFDFSKYGIELPKAMIDARKQLPHEIKKQRDHLALLKT